MPLISGQGSNIFTVMWFREGVFSLEYVMVEESERSEAVSLEGELTGGRVLKRNILVNKELIHLLFITEVLQDSLSATLSSQRRLHTRLSASGKRLRVLVVTPG